MSLAITEDYILPTKGSIYGVDMDPVIKLRTMTVADEAKRAAPTKTPYKTMCEIIDSCIVNKLPVSSYDMCMNDYLFLLQKLRIVSYDANYKMQTVCPKCGSLITVDVDLDRMEVTPMDETVLDKLNVELPSGRKCTLKLQTPRDLDALDIRKDELKEQFPDMPDPTYLLTLALFMVTLDGRELDEFTGLDRIKALPVKDANFILDRVAEVSESFGIKHSAHCRCNKCRQDIDVPFRYQNEFYRPHN